MDLNLDTLKREILEYLHSGGFAVFHGSPGGLDSLPLVLWDTGHYPDYHSFLDAALHAGAKLIVFASREFGSDDVEELFAQLDDCDLERDERRELEERLRELRVFDGVTCSIELAFAYNSHFYVFEVQPDWFGDFQNVEDEILAHLTGAGGDPDESDSLGGYFSKN